MPPELFLRELLDLDVNDDQAVAEFTSTAGLLAHPNWRRYVVPVRRDDRFERQLRKLFADHHPDVPLPHPRGDASSAPMRHVFHVEEIQTHAECIRAATRFWVGHVSGASPSELQTVWPEEGFPSPTLRTAWNTFESVLNAGLRDQQVRINVSPRADEPAFSLYPSLCLQLWNLIDEGAVPRRCGNETCNSPFVRQRDGAEHGQFHTKGVLYCSRTCARAQAQREYRRRLTKKGTKR